MCRRSSRQLCDARPSDATPMPKSVGLAVDSTWAGLILGGPKMASVFVGVPLKTT